MNIIINNSSMIPIYEQIVEQIKNQIISGNLKTHDPLPSVRAMSKELKISALTVKKAYDHLEENGFIVTIHGKGSYVAETNQELAMEEERRQIEMELERIIEKALASGMERSELTQLFTLIMEDEND